MRRANRLKSFPESRPFPDFFISTLLHVSTSFLLPIFLRASVGSFIPHYLVARVFRPIPARALLKRVFSDGKDTGCALLRGTIDDWVHWETLRIYYIGRFRWNRNKKKNCGVEWKSKSVKNIRATIFNVPSFLLLFSGCWIIITWEENSNRFLCIFRAKEISRSILRKRRILLKIVFSRSTI